MTVLFYARVKPAGDIDHISLTASEASAFYVARILDTSPDVIEFKCIQKGFYDDSIIGSPIKCRKLVLDFDYIKE